ncbi:MAG: TerC family protein [Planctomycetota bacterium]
MLDTILPLLTLAEEAAAATGSEEPTQLWSITSLIALVTLASLEIVLGIDNVVFIAIVAGKLPKEQQAKARTTGLALAAGMRVLLLLAIAWVLRLTEPLFSIAGYDLSGKSLILLGGGMFLIAKSVWEIRHQVSGHHASESGARKVASFGAAIGQILLLDLIFSLDSVITAAGMTDQIPVMIVAVLIAVGVMMAFAGPVSRFVDRHPEMKILALSFLILIGVLLVAEGLGEHLNRGYIYFAMAFAFCVDLLQMRVGTLGRPKGKAGAMPDRQN